MTKQITLMLLIILLATACAPLSTGTAVSDSTSVSPVITNIQTQGEPVISLSRQPKDSNITRGNVYIQEIGLVIRESYPPQIALIVNGDLPTPCHQLAADVSEPDTKNKIIVAIYSVVDPNMVCTK